MCLSSLPGLARVRHWSCPERLPSLSTEELLLPVRAKDAETMVRTPGLALWEEKVLNLRGNRSNKHRNLLLGRREKVVDGAVKEEPVRCTERAEEVDGGERICVEKVESMQERLLRAFLTGDQEGGNPDAEKCLPTCDNLLDIQEEASLSDHSTDMSLELPDDEALSSGKDVYLHISASSSPLQRQLPPEPGPSEVPCLQPPSNHLRDEPESNLTATRPDPKPPTEQDETARSSDQRHVLNPPPALLPEPPLSSYSYISALAPC